MPHDSGDPISGEQAFIDELTRQIGALRRYAGRLAKSPTDAEDLLQDTLLRCWRARSRFEPGTNFAGWARTIMRNAFLSSLRRGRHEVDLADDAIERLQGVAPEQTAAVELQDVIRALDHLVSGQQRAVILASEGATTDEGALALGVPANTYKSWVRRGRAHLTRLVEGDERPAPAAIDRRVVPATDHRRKRHRPEPRRWAGVMIG